VAHLTKALSAPQVALVTLEYAGRTWRLSSSPISVEDSTGTDRLYRGGVAAFDVFQTGDLSGVSRAPSQSFEAIVPADLAALTAEEHFTSEATAEIALISEGQTFGERTIIISGSVDVESEGYSARPLRFQVTAEDPAEKPGAWPPIEAVCNDETWGGVVLAHRDEEDGNPYPSVFGEAGSIIVGGDAASITAVPVIPVLCTRDLLVRSTPWGLVDQWWTWPLVASKLPYGIIADGWLYPGESTDANQGIVKGFVINTGETTIPAAIDCELVYARDLQGRLVTMVNGLVDWDSLLFTLDENKVYFVAISRPCCGGGSLTYLDGLRGAGSIIRWALERSEVLVDWRRSSSALAVLDRFELAGFWNEPCDPWSWLVDNVFPLLPCSWVAGPQGVYPVVWRLDATHYSADATLTDGLNCTIQGPVGREGDPLTAHTLDYGSALFGGVYRRRAGWHGKPERETTRESTSLHLKRAQLRYGSRRGSVWLTKENATTTDMLSSDQAADRVLAWRSRVNSQPAQVLRVVSDGLHHRSKVAALEPGMAVSLTSGRYSFTNRTAFVRQSGKLGGVYYADLVILSAP